MTHWLFNKRVFLNRKRSYETDTVQARVESPRKYGINELHINNLVLNFPLYDREERVNSLEKASKLTQIVMEFEEALREASTKLEQQEEERK
jgi:hypothetical protein